MEITLVFVVFKMNVSLAFGQLGTVRVQDEGQVSELRRFPTQRIVEQDVFGCGDLPLHAPEDVADPHVMIVDNVGKMIGRESVGFDEDRIALDLGDVVGEGAVDQVLVGQGSQPQVKSDRVGLGAAKTVLDLLVGHVTAPAVVFGVGSGSGGLLAQELETFLGAEAAIGRPVVQESLDVRLVQIQTFALSVRAIRATLAGTNKQTITINQSLGCVV